MFTQIRAHLGFGWATRVVAFVILATSSIPLAVMKPRTSPPRRRNLLDHTAFKDLPYVLFNFGLLFGFMGLYIVFYYIQLYALLEAHVTPAVADYALVILNASSLLGRVVLGYNADAMGSINVQTVVVFFNAVLTFCLIAIRNEPGLIVYTVLYGFFAGAFMGLPAAGVATLSPDRGKIGTRLGMTLAFVGVGVLISNPVAGAILGARDDWVGLIVWCGVLLSASALSVVASRVAKVGLQFTIVI